MSIENPEHTPEVPDDEAGIPELSALGRRIELLRLDRRLTKRQLAQRSGISRQQLWRVMTGKAEVTVGLGARLATVLEVDSRALVDGAPNAESTTSSIRSGTLADFVSDPVALSRALGALPADDHGRALKRSLLNAIEDLAASTTLALPAHFFELRRQVVNGER
jgi:transcriptional regulator with XRE-family HTH domain